jgi:riboflavin synthase
MFTGIVTAIGTIRHTSDRGDLRVVIACPYDPAQIAIGASIACSGVCLTVVDRGGQPGDAWFAVDVSGETVSRTAQDMWSAGRRLNLEQALKLGDELGGHIVTGHVDAVGRVTAREDVGGSLHLVVTTPAELSPFVAPKGSITVDGVSLTVNAVDDHADGTCTFHLNIIPHTAEVTTLGGLKTGDGVNLEIDVLARYLKRMQSLRA